jgi:hypothetical protein
VFAFVFAMLPLAAVAAGCASMMSDKKEPCCCKKMQAEKPQPEQAKTSCCGTTDCQCAISPADSEAPDTTAVQASLVIPVVHAVEQHNYSPPYTKFGFQQAPRLTDAAPNAPPVPIFLLHQSLLR